MSMELYQLRSFVAVAEEGHLTRAAERLYISQPAVSAHIRALEEELAVALFSRTPKGMTLTPSGQALKIRALQVLASADELRQHAKTLAQSLAGTVCLAVHIAPQFIRLPALISTLQGQYPEVRCELRQGMSWEIEKEIRSGLVDAGFLYGLANLPELSALHLRDFPLRVVGPAAWQQRLEGAGWPEIAAMPWIWTPEQCLFSQVVGAAFAMKNLTPRQTVVAEQEAVLSALVAAGVGLSVMIEEEALAEQRAGSIALWPEPLGSIPLTFACLSRRLTDPLIQAVLQCLTRVWELPASG